MHFYIHGGRRGGRGKAAFGCGPEPRDQDRESTGFGWAMHGRRGGGGWSGERSGGRRKRFDGDELRLIILKLIGDEPRHGYDVIREIEELSGGAYAPSPGLVYPMLTLLADMDHIAEQPSEGSRKIYAITDTGTAELTEKAAEVEEALGRLAALAERSDRGGGAPLGRAMGNLGLAISNQLAHLGGDRKAMRERMFEIVEIIDEAAKKVERL